MANEDDCLDDNVDVDDEEEDAGILLLVAMLAALAEAALFLFLMGDAGRPDAFLVILLYSWEFESLC